MRLGRRDFMYFLAAKTVTAAVGREYLMYFWCQKYQNHPQVAFAGPSLGCAKTGA